MFRGWGLGTEHTIFSCHSGKQKNFTERLWWEFKRAHHYPFFDKCPDNLPEGHEFPSAIIQAARQCHVAILALSEDFFTRSRWPMIELNEFVKAQASTNSYLKLLPLFYKISVEEFKDEERQKQWQDIWHGWAADDRRSNGTHKLNVGAWVFALSMVGKCNRLEYVEEVGKVTYVASVVDVVRKLKLPRVKYDVSHVQ